jgi:hypothetical protein
MACSRPWPWLWIKKKREGKATEKREEKGETTSAFKGRKRKKKFTYLNFFLSFKVLVSLLEFFSSLTALGRLKFWMEKREKLWGKGVFIRSREKVGYLG